jgi:hypothetical protein
MPPVVGGFNENSEPRCTPPHVHVHTYHPGLLGIQNSSWSSLAVNISDEGQCPLVLIKEASCAVLSSPQPSTLELCHCLRPMTLDTAVPLSGGCSYIAHTIPTGLFGGGSFNFSVYMTGLPEDKLQLRLQLLFM